MKKLIFTFFFIFLSGWLISCNDEPAVQSFDKTDQHILDQPAKKHIEKKNPNLTSILHELAVSPDPVDFATKHHIFLDENRRVRVYIIFEPSTSDPEIKKILDRHRSIIEKSAANMIRGMVPVDQLIPLAQDPVIQTIRLPDKLIKAKEITQ